MPAEDLLKAGENRALSSGEAPLYTGSGKPAAKLNKRGFKSKRTRNAIVSLVLTILMGGGIFFTMTGNTAIVGQFSSNIINQVGNANYSADVNRTVFLTSYFLRNSASENSLYKNIPDSLKETFSKNGIEIEGPAGNQTFRWKGETYQADQLKTLYKSNPDFRKAYSSSTKVRSSNFYSKSTNGLMQKWGATRNNLKDFKSSNDSDADAQKYREIQEPHFDTNDSTAGVTKQHEVDKRDETGQVIRDENGNVIKETVYEMDSKGSSGKVDASSGQVTDVAKASAKSYIETASRAASANATYCAAYRVANMISLVTSSLATYSAIKLGVSVMESFSKTQVGEGESSAINTVLNRLMENRTVTVTDYSKVDSSNYQDENAGQVELTGAAIQEPGLASIVSGTVLAAGAGKYFSNANINTTAMKTFGTNQNRFQSCAIAQAGAAAASLISIAITGGIAKVASTFVIDFVGGLALNTAISAILGFAIPTVARLLFTNTFDSSVGMVLGAGIAMGLAATSAKLAQNTGAAYANKELNNKYARETATTIALDAEVDRLNRSPFDTSSQNTFLGSIVHSFIPFQISSNVTPIKTLTSITSSSLAKLNKSIFAAGAVEGFTTTYGDCPDADDNGMSGNIYCTVNLAHDTSTNDLAPDDPTYLRVLQESGLEIDENGKHKIKPNSDLAKYISFVIKRESEPGTMDANIIAAIEESTTHGLDNPITNSLPVVGDIVDMISALIDLIPDTVAWALGTKNSNDPNVNPEWETKYKYLAQYVSDMNDLTNLGVSDANNAIATYIEEYEKEHPVDNSRAGYIARISGITKQDAETVLALVDYYEFLDDYDRSSVIATEDQTNLKTSSVIIAEASSDPIIESTPQTALYLSSLALNLNQPIYNDLRNRSYAV